MTAASVGFGVRAGVESRPDRWVRRVGG